jgi:tRNA threonylcarbamoyladenosine biosynthesis protein TsaB
VLLLCLDTATPQVSLAIGADGGVLGEVRLGRDRRHAEHLAPAIEYLCRELDVQLSQLSGIAVGLGPGLFTGLRVGVTTAKTMAQALRLPVVGVASLDLVAYALRHTNRLLAAMLDARRGEVFHARYRPVPGGVLDRSELAGPSFAFPSAAALVELATARMEREDFSSAWDVQPLYLRRSDAEIEWERREAS